MAYRQSDLQPAFNVPGTYDFTVWGYGTTDTLDEVLEASYMPGNSSILRVGDLIYVKTVPRRERVDGPEEGETRVAMVMVCGWERGHVRLRLVQDFGRPEDGPGEEQPAPGRPATAVTVTAPAATRPAASAAIAPEPPRRAVRLPGRRPKPA